MDWIMGWEREKSKMTPRPWGIPAASLEPLWKTTALQCRRVDALEEAHLILSPPAKKPAEAFHCSPQTYNGTHRGSSWWGPYLLLPCPLTSPHRVSCCPPTANAFHFLRPSCSAVQAFCTLSSLLLFISLTLKFRLSGFCLDFLHNFLSSSLFSHLCPLAVLGFFS